VKTKLRRGKRHDCPRVRSATMGSDYRTTRQAVRMSTPAD
jgi:hypothetical protein